jgi:hypothetical protein
MAGYTRQSSAQILSGEIVSAAPINAEYNQIVSAFDESTGHKHDGTSAEGPPIDRIADADQNNKILIDTGNNHIEFYIDTGASTQQFRIEDGAIVPITDDDIDLGAVGAEFKDLHLDGTANIDSLVADTADINGGTVDGSVIGGTTPAAATMTDLTATGTINFAGATVSNGGTVTTVAINGGTISGITDLAIADGGTAASNASDARDNLGLTIGTNIQAYDAGLQSIAGLTTAADKMIYTTALDTYAVTDLSAAGRALIDDASAGDQRTTLGLGTMATQNANSVAITGGTISGITNLSDTGNTLPFSFSTTITDSDPGSGVFRLDNATQNTATNIYIDDEDSNAVDVSAFIQTLSGGNNPSSILGLVTLRKEFAPEVFLQFKVTGIINAAGYTKLAVTNLSSSTANPFSNSDNVLIDISLSGDKGDAGDITGPVSSTDNAIARWDGTSGNLIQDSSVLIADDGTLTTTGGVGIGTSSPDQFVHISKATVGDTSSLLVSNPDGNAGASAALKLGVSPEDNSVAKFAIIHERFAAYGGGDTYFCSNYDADATEVTDADAVVTIKGSTGNVGIGTNSPDGKLSIQADATSDVDLRIFSDTAYTTRIYLGDTASQTQGAIGYYNSADALFFQSNGSERMRVDSSGNVGIGLTPTTNKLEVAGTIESTSGGFKFPDGSIQTTAGVSTGKVLQVVQTTKTDTASISNPSAYADISGLSVAITPAATSSKVLVRAVISFANSTSGEVTHFRLMRDSTAIGVGDAASNRPRSTSGNIGTGVNATYQGSTVTLEFLDSPNTTSATTYKVQIGGAGAQTAYINRTSRDLDTSTYDARAVSTITAMEIGA